MNDFEIIVHRQPTASGTTIHDVVKLIQTHTDPNLQYKIIKRFLHGEKADVYQRWFRYNHRSIEELHRSKSEFADDEWNELKIQTHKKLHQELHEELERVL